MIRRFRQAAALGVVALTAGACATVTTGTSQSTAVNSQPEDAECTLTRDGVTLGIVRTPSPVTVKRDSKPIHVLCRKDGHEDGKVVMGAQYESMSAGNFILGGVVGAVVDSGSGASNRYNTSVTVQLPPLVGGIRPAS